MTQQENEVQASISQLQKQYTNLFIFKKHLFQILAVRNQEQSNNFDQSGLRLTTKDLSNQFLQHD
ncbi:unnamed protein product [Paramecium primaurelia]|uniref:Uncharacterized protein n=1 Tax=Paramecium primaurelia TaxID=5886 RepID=A0A8S1PNN7_PARPR|nr:unnamed protein product [Paramecium primaurelia]